MHTARLSIELQERIMDFGTVDPTDDPTVYPTLCAWSLTHSSLYPRSRVNLFYHVHISSESQFTRFTTVVAENPQLATSVVKVTLAPHPSSLLPFAIPMKWLKNMQHINIGIDWTKYPSWYALRMGCFEHVQCLQLADTSFRDPKGLVRLLQAFPELRTLRLTAVKFEKDASKWAQRDKHGCGKTVPRKLEVVCIIVRI